MQLGPKGSDGSEYTNTQTHNKAFHVHTASAYTQTDTQTHTHTQNDIQVQTYQHHKRIQKIIQEFSGINLSFLIKATKRSL